MSRPSITYDDVELDYLDKSDLVNIEIRAKFLSLPECYDYLCIDTDELSKQEKRACLRAHSKGRKQGIVDAGEALFTSMRQRGGHGAAMNYLAQLSDTFTMDIESTPGSGKGGGFSFNVNLNDPNKDKA